MWLTFTHVGGKPSPPCRNGAPSTLSASLWSGLCYLINLIEERPFLLFLKNAIWVFFLGVNVFPSKCCISHFIFHVFYASRSFSFFLFSGLRFPHGVRPCQLLCWRRPRWFSTSSDLWLFSRYRNDLCACPGPLAPLRTPNECNAQKQAPRIS